MAKNVAVASSGELSGLRWGEENTSVVAGGLLIASYLRKPVWRSDEEFGLRGRLPDSEDHVCNS